LGSTIAVIPARSGSKGIPSKNLVNFCGKPLLEWTIEQALSVNEIDSVWVSSDGDEILEVARKCGAKTIKRPDFISGDEATSESAWLHSLDYLEQHERVDLIVALQATSPIRHGSDIANAITQFRNEKLDTLFSAVEIEDYFIWKNENCILESINYDYKTRKRRQEIEKKYLENGSFYIFRAESFKEFKNRLHGKIGIYLMEKYKMFQIDSIEDVKLNEAIMERFIL